MSEASKDPAASSARTGKAPAIEVFLDRYVGNGIHLFLSFLAIVIVVAAAIAAVDILIRDFPQLWRRNGNEYDVLHHVIQSILLVAIAGELGLLLLFHRAGAAIEVIIFVVARKMVTPDISGVELLLGTASLVALVAARHYFIREQNERNNV
jgi:phosphate-starvation-inducible protein E